MRTAALVIIAAASVPVAAFTIYAGVSLARDWLRDHLTSRRTVAEVVDAADRGAARVAESKVTDFDREFAYENGVLL